MLSDHEESRDLSNPRQHHYDLSESVEIPERSNDKKNAHVIEEVEKIYVTEEVERSAEDVDADVVEMIEDAHEVMSGEVYVMIL